MIGFGDFLHSVWNNITGTIDDKRSYIQLGFKNTNSPNTTDFLNKKLVTIGSSLDEALEKLKAKFGDRWNLFNDADKLTLIMQKLMSKEFGKNYNKELLSYAAQNNLQIDDVINLLLDLYNRKKALDYYKNNSNYNELSLLSTKALTALVNEGYRSEDLLAKEGFDNYNNYRQSLDTNYKYLKYDPNNKRLKALGLKHIDNTSLKVNKDALEFALKVNNTNLATDEEVKAWKDEYYNNNELKINVVNEFDKLAREANKLYALTIDTDNDIFNSTSSILEGNVFNDTLWDKDINGEEFTDDSRIRLLSGYKARALKNPYAAMMWFKDELQDIAAKNTSSVIEVSKLPSHFTHTITSLMAGGLVNLENKVLYAMDAFNPNVGFKGADLNYAKRLMGKDESWEPEYENENNPEYGKHDLSFWNSLKYWNGVSSYNTFSPNEINSIELNYEGITENNYIDSSQGPSLGTQVLEGVEMGALIMALLLMTRGIGMTSKAIAWLPNKTFNMALNAGSKLAMPKVMNAFNKVNNFATEIGQFYIPLLLISGAYAYGNFLEALDKNTLFINLTVEDAVSNYMKKTLDTENAKNWINNRFLNLYQQALEQQQYLLGEVKAPIDTKALYQKASLEYVYGIQEDPNNDLNKTRLAIKETYLLSDEYKQLYYNALSSAGGAAMRDNIIETVKYAPVLACYRQYVMPRAALVRVSNTWESIVNSRYNPRLLSRTKNLFTGKGFKPTPRTEGSLGALTELEGRMILAVEKSSWWKPSAETRHALNAVFIGGGFSNYTDELTSGYALHYNQSLFKERALDTINLKDEFLDSFNSISEFNNAMYTGFSVGHGGVGYMNSALFDFYDKATASTSYDAFFVGVLGSLLPTSINPRRFKKALRLGEFRFNANKNSSGYGLYEGLNIDPLTGKLAPPKGGFRSALSNIVGTTGFLTNGWQLAKVDYNSKNNLLKMLLEGINLGLDHYIKNTPDLYSIFNDLANYEYAGSSPFANDFKSSAGFRTAMFIAKALYLIGSLSPLLNSFLSKILEFSNYTPELILLEILPLVLKYIKDNNLNIEDTNDAAEIELFLNEAILKFKSGLYSFLQNIDKFKTKYKSIDKTFGWNLDEDSKMERAYHELMLDTWKDRLDWIETTILGVTKSPKPMFGTLLGKKYGSLILKDHSGLADYRTLELITEELNGETITATVFNNETGEDEEQTLHNPGLYELREAILNSINDYNLEIKEAQKNGEIDNSAIVLKTIEEMQLLLINLSINRAEARRKYLRELKKAHEETQKNLPEEELTSFTLPVVTAEEISKMSPADRSFMLLNKDKFNLELIDLIESFINLMIDRFSINRENLNLEIDNDNSNQTLENTLEKSIDNDLLLTELDLLNRRSILEKKVINRINYLNSLYNQIKYTEDLINRLDYNNTLKINRAAILNLTNSFITMEMAPRIRLNIINKGDNKEDIYAYIYENESTNAREQWELIRQVLDVDSSEELLYYREVLKGINYADDTLERLFSAQNPLLSSEDIKLAKALLWAIYTNEGDLNIESTSAFMDMLNNDPALKLRILDKTNTLINTINSKELDANDTINTITEEDLNRLVTSAINFNNQLNTEVSNTNNNSSESSIFDMATTDDVNLEKRGNGTVSTEVPDIGSTSRKSKYKTGDLIPITINGKKSTMTITGVTFDNLNIPSYHGFIDGDSTYTISDIKDSDVLLEDTNNELLNKYEEVDHCFEKSKIDFRLNTNIFYSELLGIAVNALKSSEVPSDKILSFINTVLEDSKSEKPYNNVNDFMSYLSDIPLPETKIALLLLNITPEVIELLKEKVKQVNNDIINGKVFNFSSNEKYLITPVDGTMLSYNMVFAKLFEYGPSGNKGTGIVAEFKKLGGEEALLKLEKGTKFNFIYEKSDKEENSKIWLVTKSNTGTIAIGEDKYQVIGLLSNRTIDDTDTTIEANLRAASKKYNELYKSVRALVDEASDETFLLINKDNRPLESTVDEIYAARDFVLNHKGKEIFRDMTQIFTEEGADKSTWIHANDNSILEDTTSNKGIRWIHPNYNLGIAAHIEYNGRTVLVKTLTETTNKDGKTLLLWRQEGKSIIDFNESTKLAAREVSNYLFGNGNNYEGIGKTISLLLVEQLGDKLVPTEESLNTLNDLSDKLWRFKLGSGLFLAKNYLLKIALNTPAAYDVAPSIDIYLTDNTQSDYLVTLNSSPITLALLNSTLRRQIVETLLNNLIFDLEGNIRRKPNTLEEEYVGSNEILHWQTNWGYMTSTSNDAKPLKDKQRELDRIWEDNLLKTQHAFLHPLLAGFTFKDPINKVLENTSNNTPAVPLGDDGAGNNVPNNNTLLPPTPKPDSLMLSLLLNFSNKVKELRERISKGAPKKHISVTAIANLNSIFLADSRKDLYLGFGNTIDTFIRKVQSGIINTGNIKEKSLFIPNADRAQYEKLFEGYNKLLESLKDGEFIDYLGNTLVIDRAGLTPVFLPSGDPIKVMPKIQVIGDNGTKGQLQLLGEIDLLFKDANGNYYVVDIKTKYMGESKSILERLEALRSSIDYWTKQDSIYINSLSSDNPEIGGVNIPIKGAFNIIIPYHTQLQGKWSRRVIDATSERNKYKNESGYETILVGEEEADIIIEDPIIVSNLYKSEGDGITQVTYRDIITHDNNIKEGEETFKDKIVWETQAPLQLSEPFDDYINSDKVSLEDKDILSDKLTTEEYNKLKNLYYNYDLYKRDYEAKLQELGNSSENTNKLQELKNLMDLAESNFTIELSSILSKYKESKTLEIEINYNGTTFIFSQELIEDCNRAIELVRSTPNPNNTDYTHAINDIMRPLLLDSVQKAGINGLKRGIYVSKAINSIILNYVLSTGNRILEDIKTEVSYRSSRTTLTRLDNSNVEEELRINCTFS